MTIRMATCRELATDLDAIDKLQKDYWMLKNSATPAALLLPWLPSMGSRNRKQATKNLYKTLYGYVEKRKVSTPSSDAIDTLLARGLSADDTIRVGIPVSTVIPVSLLTLYDSSYLVPSLLASSTPELVVS
jgi:hypothetical protein